MQTVVSYFNQHRRYILSLKMVEKLRSPARKIRVN